MVKIMDYFNGVQTAEPVRSEKTAAERAFKVVVIKLVSNGIYPSSGQIEKFLGRKVSHNLNGRECRWRSQVLTELGWTYVGRETEGSGRPSWTPPPPWKLKRGPSCWFIIPRHYDVHIPGAIAGGTLAS